MKLVSGIVDSGFFAQSALSAEVATKDSLGRNISETYLTGVDLTPYQTTAEMSSYANSAEVTGTAQYGLTTAGWSEITGGGGVTGDFELKEGNGIQLTDDPIAQTTTISVSGDYATNTQLQTVSGEITALIPSTAGLATESFVTSQGYITNDAITGKQDITGMTAYATVESLTAKQDAGDYLSASDSANFLLTSDSGNFYPMNENPAGYLTEHQSLADYQTTAGMTAYMTTGDSAEFMTIAERSDYIPTGVSSEFYTTANTANYISEVPDTYLQNTDLSTEDGKVTAISGIPLSAGGDVPSGVMVESGLEYNAVNEISGYNGSAIAQYGAEKQFIVHDDTMVHLSNSAQFALGVNLSAVEELATKDLQPKLNQETFAGYWNGYPVYQQIVTLSFSSNSNSTTANLPSACFANNVDNGRRWIDAAQSWIHYGSENISLPVSWYLGNGRQGALGIISNTISYRGVDNANTGCTAYICLKYRKKQS